MLKWVFIAEIKISGLLVNKMDVRSRLSLLTLVVFKVRELAKSVYRYSLPLHEQSLKSTKVCKSDPEVWHRGPAVPWPYVQQLGQMGSSEWCPP